MVIRIGNNPEPDKLYVGSDEVQKVYRGSVQVWPEVFNGPSTLSIAPSGASDYLITSTGGGDYSIVVARTGTLYDGTYTVPDRPDPDQIGFFVSPFRTGDSGVGNIQTVNQGLVYSESDAAVSSTITLKRGGVAFVSNAAFPLALGSTYTYTQLSGDNDSGVGVTAEVSVTNGVKTTTEIVTLVNAAISGWWHPNAFAQFNAGNGEYYIDGVLYPQRSAAVSAGKIVTNAAGVDQITLPGYSALTMAAKGVTPSSAATPGYAISLDDNISTTNALCFLGFFEASGTRIGYGIYLDGINGTSGSFSPNNTKIVATNTNFRTAASFSSGTASFSFDGAATTTDSAVPFPAPTQISINNRTDGDRPWTGSDTDWLVILDRVSDADLTQLLV